MRLKRKSKVEDESYCQVDKNLSTIYIVGEITQKQASSFRRYLRQLEGSKRGSSILVEINSPGGDVEAGLLIVDSIELCKKTVTTRATGLAMSMGSIILAAGARREALPNSMIMVHQATHSIYARNDEVDNEVQYTKKLEEICNEILDRKTGQAPGYWAKRPGGKNLYLTAQQALEEKLIESIVMRKVTPCVPS